MQSHIGAITSLITSPLEGHVISGSMDTSIVVRMLLILVYYNYSVIYKIIGSIIKLNDSKCLSC